MSAPTRRARGCAGSGTIALLVAAALLPTSGCSFLIDPPPKHPAPYDQINCTTSYAAPAIDVVLGVLELVSFGIVESSGSKAQKTVAQIFAIPLAGAQIGAGIGGFFRVGKCNELIASHGANRQRGSPRAYRPPAPSGIEPPPPPREPSTEPPLPGTAPAPAAAPPAPRARQQMDDE